MDDNPDSYEREKVIQVEAPKTKGTDRSLYLHLAIFALGVGSLAFILGFGVGKINLSVSDASIPTSATPSAKIKGGGLYVNEENLFAISYPTKWEIKKHGDADFPGAKFISKKGSVDFWLLADQPYLLGSKHRKAIESEEEFTITIDDREIKGTRFNYKAGNFFMVLVLPGTTSSPQVTFWLEADDEKTKEETLNIVRSFEFLNK